MCLITDLRYYNPSDDNINVDFKGKLYCYIKFLVGSKACGRGSKNTFITGFDLVPGLLSL